MQQPPPKEAEFFESLERETPIEISVRSCTMGLLYMHKEIGNLESTGRIPDGDSDSLARHFRPGCEKLRTFFSEFTIFKNELIKLGPDNIPALLFKKLGPAFKWVMKDIRRYLDCIGNDNDPTFKVGIAFEKLKDICRPESQPDNLSAEEFEKAVQEIFKEFVDAALHAAKAIEVREEVLAEKRDRKLNLRRDRHRLPKGKGYSHFGDIGIEHNGVKLADEIHLHVYGTVIEITSQANWNMIDGWLRAHFADEHFHVTTKDLEKFNTPDELKLLKFIHQETLEEAGRRRLRNSRYTGMGWFESPAP